MTAEKTANVLYLAVLPTYREQCVRELKLRIPNALSLYAGRAHMDPTVKTGIDQELFQEVRNVVLPGPLLIQFGHLAEAVGAANVIVDLNPRSLTAWIILLLRRMLSRRTLVWGHLHPRAGARSRSAWLRKAMRRMASGTILYGYDSVVPARLSLPRQPVWVAPNSLYKAELLGATNANQQRNRILYVGRLESAKKVHLLVEAFAQSIALRASGKLTIVGAGSSSSNLKDLCEDLGVNAEFLGEVSDPERLRYLYSESLCSVSPGYVGLSLTQSLGFGVPMLVSRNEPHAPEIELHRFGGVTFFDSDSSLSLSRELELRVRQSFDHGAAKQLSEKIRSAYSAEAMADGLSEALRGTPQPLGEDGWPIGIV